MANEKAKRFQYAAIDDATRVRATKIHERHTQADAIKFVDRVIDKFPNRIQAIRTDNGHESQAKFHRHVEDKSIRHAYIKPSFPQLNGQSRAITEVVPVSATGALGWIGR